MNFRRVGAFRAHDGRGAEWLILSAGLELLNFKDPPL